MACSQLDELHLGPVHSVHKYLTHSTASLSREDSPPPPSRPGNSCGSFSREDLSLPQLTYFPLCKFFFFFCCLPSLNRAVTQCTYSPQHPTVNFDIILIMIKSCAQTQTDDECIPLTNTLCAYINCAAELSCFSKTIKTTSVAASPQKNDCTG